MLPRLEGRGNSMNLLLFQRPGIYTSNLSEADVILIAFCIPPGFRLGEKKALIRGFSAFLLRLKMSHIYIMPFIKIWIHAVWSTKNRVPSLLNGMRRKIFEYIKDNGKLKGIHVDFVNGHFDHMHCLISLKATQDIATVIQLLKGDSQG